MEGGGSGGPPASEAGGAETEVPRKDDVLLLADEKFDFDLSLSSLSANEDDEVFFGPVGHKERCVAANLELGRPGPSPPQPPSSASESPFRWSPLAGEKFVEVYKEARLLALQIESSISMLYSGVSRGLSWEVAVDRGAGGRSASAGAAVLEPPKEKPASPSRMKIPHEKEPHGDRPPDKARAARDATTLPASRSHLVQGKRSLPAPNKVTVRRPGSLGHGGCSPARRRGGLPTPAGRRLSGLPLVTPSTVPRTLASPLCVSTRQLSSEPRRTSAGRSTGRPLGDPPLIDLSLTPEAPVASGPGSRPLLDLLANTPDTDRKAMAKPLSGVGQLIDLCSPLIQLSPEANKENVDSPLLKF
ncbi:PREDICTED: G2 and S phase-expressed protein 1 [Myotis brandtii]|uniref:G2 and S phase-expressed protein 1 n=1 Tax=Myotis brandtii TaxID=109478 RepID=UPI000704721C|nr:PREDICTED: G2 and S phase-expressed protein 1 [Myotis brandtii]